MHRYAHPFVNASCKHTLGISAQPSHHITAGGSAFPRSPIVMNGRTRNVLLRLSSLCVFALPAGPSRPRVQARDCVLQPSSAICGTESVENGNSHRHRPFRFLFCFLLFGICVSGQKRYEKRHSTDVLKNILSSGADKIPPPWLLILNILLRRTLRIKSCHISKTA